MKEKLWVSILEIRNLSVYNRTLVLKPKVVYQIMLYSSIFKDLLSGLIIGKYGWF